MTDDKTPDITQDENLPHNEADALRSSLRALIANSPTISDQEIGEILRELAEEFDPDEEDE